MLKPLSLNQAYRGRRFTTPLLKSYKEAIGLFLKRRTIPEGKLAVTYRFGVSTKNSDGDNLVKCFQDALAEYYGFNDNRIYRWQIEKVDVEKEQEFIEFDITGFSKITKG